MDFPFWFYCVGNLVVLAAILWWRGPRKVQETLPAERLVSALKTGLRYARYNRDIDSTLMRAIAFFLFASAYWALLPLIARTQLNTGPETYGVLLGMVGLGSIVGSLLLVWLKERLGPDGLAALATFGTIAALVLFGAARDPWVASAASFIAGAAWIVMLTTLFVSAQVALPEWVRGRGLAIYLTVYFGAMTAGSAIWGKIAGLEGISGALYIAAGGALLGFLATARRKLQTGAVLDLSPAMHWSRPVFARRVGDDEGPILVSIDYRVAPENRGKFLAALQEIGDERRRDGAYAWNAFEDTGDLGRVVEVFLIQSLLELRHLRARVTSGRPSRGAERPPVSGRAAGHPFPSRAETRPGDEEEAEGLPSGACAGRDGRGVGREASPDLHARSFAATAARCRSMRRRVSSASATRAKRGRAPSAANCAWR